MIFLKELSLKLVAIGMTAFAEKRKPTFTHM
jgi:hypothetical protein